MTRALADLLDDDPAKSVVYFIESSAAIKIGYSTHLWKRFADLQTSAAEPLYVIDYALAGKEIEAELHRLLDSERLQGEWFRASDKTCDLMFLISDFIESFDEEEDQMRDGRDCHVLTLDELRHIIANPYYWRREE